MCPDTTIYLASSYYYICVFILLFAGCKGGRCRDGGKGGQRGGGGGGGHARGGGGRGYGGGYERVWKAKVFRLINPYLKKKNEWCTWRECSSTEPCSNEHAVCVCVCVRACVRLCMSVYVCV
jgi:hypothetical protein